MIRASSGFRRSLALPSLLAAAAGATGLSFEILWARELTLQVGEPLAAFTIVVTSFLAGLSVGAAVIGRIADRVAAPLERFAQLQLLIAAMGTASAFLTGSGGLTRAALLALKLAPDQASFTLTEILLSGASIFVPAALMGGTLPLLLAASTSGAGERDAARRGGLLAAANAAGAAAGSLLCAFALLPSAGLSATLLIVSAVTVLNGCLAWVCAARGRVKTPSGVDRVPEDRLAAAHHAAGAGVPLLSPAARVVLVLFASGLALTSLEVVWARLVHLSFGSSAQAASLVLAAVISGLAAGNALGSRLPLRQRASGKALGSLACAAAFATIATDPLLGRLPLLAALLEGWMESSSWSFIAIQLAQISLIFAMVAIPCALIGAIFPTGYRALLQDAPSRAGDARLIGMASAAVSAGNLAGAPLAYWVLVGRAGARAGLVASALMLAVSAMIPARAGAWRAAASLAMFMILATAMFSSWDPAVMSSGPYLYGSLYELSAGSHTLGSMRAALHDRGELVFTREGPQALVTVRRSPSGILSLQVNGKTDASTGGDLKTQTLMAQIPLLTRPPPAGEGRVLVIGWGSGITVASALTHPISSLTVIEISPEVVETASLFAQSNRNALDDPRVELVLGDARTRLIFGDRTYDVIISQPSNPWIAGQAVLFTREFFDLARSRLSKGGVMCQWVQGYGLLSEDFQSVVATFAAVFPNVSLWEESTAGGDYILLGSMEPLTIDPGRLASAMRAPEVAADLARIEVEGPGQLLPHLVASADSVRRFATGARVQTEDRLELESSAPRALRAETLGGILASLEPIRIQPAGLASLASDRGLAAELLRRASAAKKERAWAAGLGLLEAGDRRGGGADPAFLAALSYLRAGMKEHALRTVRDLARRRPSERLPRVLLAHLAMSAGLVEESVKELEAAAAIDPEDARLRVFLSRALFASGNLPAALARNAEALRLAPALAEASSDRCAMLMAAGDAASAEAACREAVALDDGLAEAHANLGLAHARRGRSIDAEGSYRRALEIDPDLLDARFNLASLLEREGRAAEAMAVLRAALPPEAPPDAQTMRLAARLSYEAGNLPAARGWLRESLQIEPTSEEAAEIARMIGP